MNQRGGLERVLELTRVALGRLRAGLLGIRGARVGLKVYVGPRCMVDRPHGAALDDQVVLEADVYLKLVADSARLRLGESTFVGRGSELDVILEVTVGSHTLIAPGCFITDHTHGLSAGARIDQQPCAPAPVVIGSDVWLGYGVVVLPGVTIGDGAVVGANSVVTTDVAPMAIVAGAPARLIRLRDVGESPTADIV